VVVAALAAVMLFGLLIYDLILYGHADQSYVEVDLPLFGNVGTSELIGVGTGLLGLAAMVYCRFAKPQFFLDRSMRYGPSLTEEGEVVPQAESDLGPI
jgi:hypothetical protein